MSKTCTKCLEEKNFSEFNKSTDTRLRSQCKTCQRAQWKDWRERNKDKREAWNVKAREERYFFAKHLKAKFGLTLSDYDSLIAKQDNLCAICLKPETRKGKKKSDGFLPLAVDHCHETGKIRALLCGACNTSLGLLREDVTILESMISYLKEHE